MNKMHEIAKIAFAVLGIYFLIGLVQSLVFTIAMIFSQFSGFTVAMVVISILFTLGCAYAVFYFLIIKRDWLAGKIVSTEQEIVPGTTASWLPIAYRLAVLVVALLFLRSVLWEFTSLVNRILSTRGIEGYSGRYMKEMILKLIFTLPVTIYLLCGAPHFVRWQIKKTTEFCKEFETENSDNN